MSSFIVPSVYADEVKAEPLNNTPIAEPVQNETAKTMQEVLGCTFFAVSNILALTAFYLGGVDFSEALREAPYILPGLALGVAAGYAAAGRVPADVFRRVLYVILVAMCLHTIWTAASAL